MGPLFGGSCPLFRYRLLAARHLSHVLLKPLAVARIALVKPEKARGVENMILNMAQRGQINEKARARAAGGLASTQMLFCNPALLSAAPL